MHKTCYNVENGIKLAKRICMLKVHSNLKRFSQFIAIDAITIFSLTYILSELFTSIGMSLFQVEKLILNSLILFLLLVLNYVSLGFYYGKSRVSAKGMLMRGAVSILIAYFSHKYLLGLIDIKQTPILTPIILVLSLLTHVYWRKKFFQKGYFKFSKRKVVFLGAGERASFISKRMRRAADRRSYSFWGFITLGRVESSILEREKIIPSFDSDKALRHFIKQNDIDVIVLANESHEELPLSLLLDLKIMGVQVTELEEFVENELGQVMVESIKKEALLTSEGYEVRGSLSKALNYLVNFCLATIVLSLTAPITLITAILIYFDDGKNGGTIFYSQRRVGLNGRYFNIVKFRSMGVDAEKDGAQWATKNDMRVTKIGAYLRKYRIDELPQLINVFKGEMNFVGPRPERPEFVTALSKEINFFEYRHAVKPGLTGWAQVSYPYGASTNDSFEKLKFDLYYVKHRGFFFDFFILLRTVEVVVFGQGR